jgi:Tfp pilus assembly protein PilW
MRRHFGSSESGFSLVELLVSSVIVTAMMGTVIMVASQMQRSYTSQVDGAGVQQEARFALDWITRTLVSAGSNPQAITIGACPAAGTAFRAIRRDPNADGVQNDVRVHADINPPNGVLGGVGGILGCTESREDITISYDAANRSIMRRDNNTEAAAVPMSDTVISNLLFTYLDNNRVATANDGSVAFVRVTVTAQTPQRDAYRNAPLTFTMSEEVRVRTR